MSNVLASAQTLAYLAAALLFIFALAGLARQKTARRGNRLGAAGMALALCATIAVALLGPDGQGAGPAAVILAALVIGGAVGVVAARRVQMTAMPQLVALLHSFVGAAAVAVGINSFLAAPGGALPGSEGAFHLGEVGLAVFIGAVTLTGSIVAYLKLAGKVSGKPVTLPGRNGINLAVVLVCVACIVWLVYTQGAAAGAVPLGIITVLALLLGVHLVAAIGGGDMPVVVSMLNSLSGWAAAMAGFTLGNDLLIITGALVGSSGAYLSYIMCQGMNRSFAGVILGGFGGTQPAPAAGGAAGQQPQGEATVATVEDVAGLLRGAKRVAVAPGYGMAVAQAQFPVAQLAAELQKRGTQVQFAIHPVAGRMPGHMNVLLAEAKVPYASVLEMDEINDEFDDVDVVLVIGANDTVNPTAETDATSPIAGMPVMRVWNAKDVVVLKRKLSGAGYSGVENPLFFNDNTRMLLGDAKQTVEAVLAAL